MQSAGRNRYRRPRYRCCRPQPCCQLRSADGAGGASGRRRAIGRWRSRRLPNPRYGSRAPQKSILQARQSRRGRKAFSRCTGRRRLPPVLWRVPPTLHENAVTAAGLRADRPAVRHRKFHAVFTGQVVSQGDRDKTGHLLQMFIRAVKCEAQPAFRSPEKHSVSPVFCKKRCLLDPTAVDLSVVRDRKTLHII